jgi:hypothetical protein
MNDYLFGKGKVSLAERDANGAVSEILYLGNCPELKISGSADRVDHYESESGSNVRDRSLVKTSSMEMSVTLESMSADNLAVLVWGAKNDIAAVTTQTHEFPDGIVAGQTHIVPNGFNMTNTSLKDDAGSPVTVPTTKYDLDASFGTIQFLDVATYAQPFTLHYDRGAGVAIPFMTQQAPTRFLRFEGLNLGNPGTGVSQKFLVELYIVQFDLAQDISLIGDDFGKFELKGGLQLDDTRVTNDALGGFGRIIKL